MSDVQAIIDTLRYLKRFQGTTILIKLGGSILHDETRIKALCDDLALLRSAGIKLVLVHGGSKAINQALDTYGIESTFVDGLRVTTKEAMTVIEMVLSGHVNTMLVRKLNHIGINAIGLSGADSKLLACERLSEEHGQVGSVVNINTKPIVSVLAQQQRESDAIPVIAPIGIDERGEALNINADWAATHIAVALGVDKLIFLTDQTGIKNKTNEVLSVLSEDNLLGLIADGTVRDGMLTKVKAILFALNNDLNHIHIINGQKPHALIEELFTVNGIGTLCQKGKVKAHEPQEEFSE